MLCRDEKVFFNIPSESFSTKFIVARFIMNIQRATPVNELLAKLIFLIVPTALIAYFLLWNSNQYFGIIGDPNAGLLASLPAITNISLQLTLFFAMGMAGSAVFYSFRFRFLPSFLLLILGLYSIYKGLDSLASELCSLE